MNDDSDWEELIDRHLRGELNESEKEHLAERLDSDAAARREFVEHVQWDTQFAEMLRERRDLLNDPDVLIAAGTRERPAPGRISTLLAIAAITIVVLVASLFFQRPESESRIAKVIGLSGSLVWTGNDGQIVRDLSLGSELSGGTIEGMAPDSWFELKFNDGSTVMISGHSMLTFADDEQKMLRLKQGSLSANVVPQPAGRPMQIRTPSALLEVLGTQFDVVAELASTTLNVSEGRVRVKRLSDGRTVDVPAGHRVIAAPDRDLLPQPVPDSVYHWKSQLQLGPDGAYGKWSPATDQRAASLKAIPFVPEKNKSITLYLLGLCVCRSSNSPVILKPGSRFIVRGRIAEDTLVYFGIRVAYPNGEFAGKFLARQPVTEGNFEAAYHLEDFGLDPCVRDRKDELADRPDNLVVTGVWCFTHTGGPTGLEVTEIELIPADQCRGTKHDNE